MQLFLRTLRWSHTQRNQALRMFDCDLMLMAVFPFVNRYLPSRCISINIKLFKELFNSQQQAFASSWNNIHASWFLDFSDYQLHVEEAASFLKHSKPLFYYYTRFSISLRSLFCTSREIHSDFYSRNGFSVFEWAMTRQSFHLIFGQSF